MRYTVGWTPTAQNELALLWANNPRLRSEIQFAADEIDRVLPSQAEQLGRVLTPRLRQFIQPPISVLYTVSQADYLVVISHVKFWEE
jgi:hypothetical protein